MLKKISEELLKHRQFAQGFQAKVLKTDYNHKFEFDSSKYEGLNEPQINEIVSFLRHQRQYKELLEKYQPAQEEGVETVRKTARRVGLDI